MASWPFEWQAFLARLPGAPMMADKIKSRQELTEELRERNRLNHVQETALINAMHGFRVPDDQINNILHEAKARINSVKILIPQEPNEILLERLYKLAIDPDLLALLANIIERLPATPDWSPAEARR